MFLPCLNKVYVMICYVVYVMLSYVMLCYVMMLCHHVKWWRKSLCRSFEWEKMISRKVFGLFLSYELFSVSCRLRPLSSAEVQAFVISIRCAKCTAGAKSNGSIRRRTSARCVSISRTSMDFSTSNIFIFSMKRSKVFYFDPPPPWNPWG